MDTRGEGRYPTAGSSALKASEDMLTATFGLIEIKQPAVIKMVETVVDEAVIDEVGYPDSPHVLLDDAKAGLIDVSEAAEVGHEDEESNEFSFGQTKGWLVDERKLTLSGLVRNFRATEVHTTVLKTARNNSGNKTFANVRIDDKESTLRGVVHGLTLMAKVDVDAENLSERLAGLEPKFLKKHYPGGKAADNTSRIDAIANQSTGTDLMRNLEAFIESMYEFHGPVYAAFCERLRRFGGFLILEEARNSAQ